MLAVTEILVVAGILIGTSIKVIIVGGGMSLPMDIAWQVLKAALFTPKSGYEDDINYPRGGKKPRSLPGHWFNKVGLGHQDQRQRKFAESLPNFPLRRHKRWPFLPGTEHSRRGEVPSNFPTVYQDKQAELVENKMNEAIEQKTQNKDEGEWWNLQNIGGYGDSSNIDEPISEISVEPWEVEAAIEAEGYRKPAFPPKEVASVRQNMRPGWNKDVSGKQRWIENREGDEPWDWWNMPKGMFDAPEE